MRDEPNQTGRCLAYYESPIGLIEIGGDQSAVTSLNFVDEPEADYRSFPYLDAAALQIHEYFHKKRRNFNIELSLGGTPFQQSVWNHLTTISHGRTTTYRAMAAAIGRPEAIRAVGAANGKNPVSIIVPCHRVIGSNGRLTGYGGGLWRKAWLLEHEGVDSFVK